MLLVGDRLVALAGGRIKTDDVVRGATGWKTAFVKMKALIRALMS